jgi:Cellulase (glycosyl hydrolase family 5)
MNRKTILCPFSALLLLLPAILVSRSQKQIGLRRVASNFFGMNLIRPRIWPAATVGALGKGAGTSWRYVEPSRGVFKWSGIDEYVDAAQRHGIDALYTFDSTPQWASARPAEKCDAGTIGCAAPPADIQDWEDFVRAVVIRYKDRVKIYELWNEPTTQLEWSGSYADMVRLAKSAYETIKSIDPDAVVLTPAPSAHGYQPRGLTSPIQPEWMAGYLRAGGDSFADGGSWHAYPWPNACTKTIDCAGSPLITQIDAMRSVFDHSRLAGKPIYVTEGGWRTSAALSDPDQQAAYVARWFILLASKGIERAYWHAWDDDKWGTLWDATTGVHLAGIAYQQTYSWLTGAAISSPCEVSDSDTWTCTLTRSGGYQGLIIWTSSGNQIYTPAKEYRQYRDLSGTTLPIQGTITIGDKPILLETALPQE